MTQFNTLYKIIVGAGTLTGTWYVSKKFDSNKIVYNSSTSSNYTPSTNWDDSWDRRPLKCHGNLETLQADSREYPNNPTRKANKHIIMVRNCQYASKAVVESQQSLTKLGVLQAQFTGKRLKELGYPYTSMITSTKTRAQQTGEIINRTLGNRLPVGECDLLGEVVPIPPEPPVQNLTLQPKIYGDGAITEEAFRKYFHRADSNQEEDSYTLIVCHANVIRYFVCRALQFPPEAWQRFSLYHGSITWVTITPTGKVIVKMLGESGHIPVNAISS